MTSSVARRHPRRSLLLACALALPFAAMGAAAAQPSQDNQPRPELTIHPAERMPNATLQMVLGAAYAGTRIVAVGDHGLVLLSDDNGKTFHQAAKVPVQTALSAVSFADDRNGWAVGQLGVVMKTADGGETWELQRIDKGTDRPLFGVAFRNAKEGLAVGLWSLILATTDGGTTWEERQVPAPPGSSRNDLNLYSVFTGQGDKIFVAAEGGKILRSDDNGKSWRYLDTGYRGTFWTGTALKDGTLLIGGLRGTIYRSLDGGNSWQPSSSDGQSSITGFAQLADGAVVATALDGVFLTSQDSGASFRSRQRDDREVLTAVLSRNGGDPLIFSKHGPQ